MDRDGLCVGFDYLIRLYMCGVWQGREAGRACLGGGEARQLCCAEGRLCREGFCAEGGGKVVVYFVGKGE